MKKKCPPLGLQARELRAAYRELDAMMKAGFNTKASLDRLKQAEDALRRAARACNVDADTVVLLATPRAWR